MNKILSLILVFVMSFCLNLTFPKRVNAESYLSDDVAQRFVELFYKTSSDTAAQVKRILTGEEPPTFEIAKDILENSSSVLGYITNMDVLDYEDQLSLTSISNLVSNANAAVMIVDNYISMWKSPLALQQTVDGIQILSSFANIWGFTIPPTVSVACVAVELTLTIGSAIQEEILNEYENIYRADLLIAKYAGSELPSPKGYIDVIIELKYTQEEVDAILSGIYLEFYIDQILNNSLSISGSTSSEEVEYAITFDSNCSDVADYSYMYNTSDGNWYVPEMSREGYIFAGWYWDSACTNSAAGQITIDQDLTFYAKWIPRYTTITFDSNCEYVDDIVCKYDILVEEWEIPVMERQGYFLEGWYWDSACTNEVTTYSRMENTTFYAKWVSEFNFSVSNNEVTITGLAYYIVINDVTITDIVVPSIIDGCTVTSIAANAFESSAITSIKLPATLVTIGERAFQDCDNLTEITIPDGVNIIEPFTFYSCSYLATANIGKGVNTIETCAFLACRKLESVTIAANVKTIEHSAFDICYNLKNFFVDDENSYLSSTNGVIYDKNQTKLILCPQGKTDAFVIPNGIKEIGEASFENCRFLTDIIIPDSVNTIEPLAFHGCIKITNITIPGSVNNIENLAFSSCDSLTNVVLENGIKTINSGAFRRCSLTSIIIPESVVEIDALVFFACDNLANIEVEENNPVFSSIDGVVYNKSKTELILCPEGKTGTFIIPEGVNTICDDAFYYCKKLTNIKIPESVQTIGDYTFRNCEQLEYIYIGSNVTKIGYSAFYGCDSLAEVYYNGNTSDFAAIDINVDNTSLTNATKYCNCKYYSDEIKIMSDGKTTTAHIAPKEEYTGKTIVFSLHNDGRLTDIESKVFSNGKLEFESVAEHDEIKIMTWDNLSSLTPACKAEKIETSDWN